MRKILLVLILILTTTPVKAFKFFPHKSKTTQLPIINENILIEGKFTNTQTSAAIPNPPLDLRIAINIPHDQKYLTITTLYDEINDNPIEQITWVVDNGKKKPATRVKPFKIDQIINQNIESLAMEYNPTLAYDRIHHNKHIINKTFYFDQAAILGDRIKTPTQFLEIYIPESKGIKTKGIRIDQLLYQVPAKQVEAQTHSPRAANPAIFNKQINSNPNQTQKAEVEDNADLEYAKQQLNNFNASTTVNPNTINTSDQEQKQLQQMQQQMQLDSLDDEGEDETEDYGEDDDEDPF